MDFVTLEPEGTMSTLGQNGVNTAVRLRSEGHQPDKYYLTKRPPS